MATKQLPTKPGRLSETARHVVIPSGIVSTGWPAVRDRCAGFGVEFDSWQDGTGRIILSKRADGSYACSIGGVVISIPRQVGKTFLIGAIIFALCLLNSGLTVIWTAHRLRTADETFASMLAFSRRKKVAPYMLRPVLGSGEEEIRFRNGSRVMFGARERGFGRGFAKVDILVFDEAQILTESAIDDMIPATNQAPNPLLLFTGTPPKPTDRSEVFTAKRAEALAGDFDDGAYIEFSADENADPNDRKQWAKANASYPTRTPDRAMLRMKKNLTPESFVREALGIWDSTNADGPITLHRWAELRDPESGYIGSPQAVVEVSPDQKFTSIAVGGSRADGQIHVEIARRQEGDAWVIPFCKTKAAELDVVFKIHESGPAGYLIPRFEDEGIPVEGVPTAACSAQRIISEVNAGTIHHRGGNEIPAALSLAVAVSNPQGVVSWHRMKSTGDISALVAITILVGGMAEDGEPQVWI